MKTIGQVSQLMGISEKTLRHYDKIGLLSPTILSHLGYRLYDDEALARLKTILWLKSLDFSLTQIATLLMCPSEHQLKALRSHLSILEQKKIQLDKTIQRIDRILEEGKLMEEVLVEDKYDQEVRERWGTTSAYVEYVRKGYPKDSKTDTELLTYFKEFGMLNDFPITDDRTQDLVASLQTYISQTYYPCHLAILSSLGEMYVADNRFKQTIDQLGGLGTAQYTHQAISYYVKSKE